MGTNLHLYVSPVQSIFEEDSLFYCPLLCVTTCSDIFLVCFAVSLGPGWKAQISISDCIGFAGISLGKKMGMEVGYFIFGTW